MEILDKQKLVVDVITKSAENYITSKTQTKVNNVNIDTKYEYSNKYITATCKLNQNLGEVVFSTNDRILLEFLKTLGMSSVDIDIPEDIIQDSVQEFINILLGYEVSKIKEVPGLTFFIPQIIDVQEKELIYTNIIETNKGNIIVGIS